MNFFNHYFDKINKAISEIDVNILEKCIVMAKKCKENEGKIIIVGNGGSSAIASHISVDLTKASNFRCVNFNESSLLTCFANDYGYENWVKEALRAYADKDDLVILISSSGQSMNMINGAIFCQENNLDLITLTGFEPNNRLRNLGMENLYVPSKHYNSVETAHQTWLLAFAEKLQLDLC